MDNGHSTLTFKRRKAFRGLVYDHLRRDGRDVQKSTGCLGSYGAVIRGAARPVHSSLHKGCGPMYWRVALLVLLTTGAPQAKAEPPDEQTLRLLNHHRQIPGFIQRDC